MLNASEFHQHGYELYSHGKNPELRCSLYPYRYVYILPNIFPKSLPLPTLPQLKL